MSENYFFTVLFRKLLVAIERVPIKPMGDCGRIEDSVTCAFFFLDWADFGVVGSLDFSLSLRFAVEKSRAWIGAFFGVFAVGFSFVLLVGERV